MKVLVCITYAANTPHFETELEIIERHLSAGDSVFVLSCTRQLLACDINPQHKLSRCLRCTGRRDRGLTALSGPVKLLPQVALRPNQTAEIASMFRGEVTVENLASMKADTFDIGYGVLSSLVSLTRDPRPDIPRMGDLPARMLASALAVYRTMQNHIDEHAFDRVYVYNGRYAIMRAVLRACESRGVSYFSHEKGATLDRFAIWENSTVHDMNNIANLVETAWQDCADDAERRRLGAEFYEDSANGRSQTWIAFTTGQRPKQLPDNWDSSRFNVAIFLSSEDELVAIGDQWSHTLYASQLDGISRILESFAAEPDFHFYIRAHPNMANLDTEQTRGLRAIQSANATVIPAESSVSTYALLRSARICITFGSTVGVEAVYWGIPSILAGPSYYKFLGATYNPDTHAELVALLKSDLVPSDRELALRYGYYWMTFGERFQHYRPTGIYTGEFKNTVLKPSLPIRALLFMLRNSGLDNVLGALDVALAKHKLGIN